MTLSTGSLYNRALDLVFELAGGAGYDGLELLVDARMESSDVPYLRQLSNRWGIPILSVHTPFAPRVEGWSAVPEERVQQAVQLAESLGAQTVVAHAPLRRKLIHAQLSLGRWSWQQLMVLPWEDRESIRHTRWLSEELPALQARTGVKIAVENMPAHLRWGRRLALHRFTEPEELSRFPYLVLDTTHWGTWGVDPICVYRALRDRIIHVHLSNYDGREHRLPFKGQLRLDGLLAEMRQGNFGGIVAVETEPWAVAEGDWSAAHLRAVLAQAAVESRQLLGLAPSHSHANRTTDLQLRLAHRAE